MVDVGNIIDIASSLENPLVSVDEEKCVAVRNRNATCTRCVDACPKGALIVWNNSIEIDAETCVGCSACATVCPTGVFAHRDYRAGSFADLIVQGSAKCANARRNGNESKAREAVVVCSQLLPSLNNRLSDCRVDVPCLAAVGVADLLEAVAQQVDVVFLSSADCTSCPLTAADKVIDETLNDIDSLLACTRTQTLVKRTFGLPSHCEACQRQEDHDVGKRKFFGDMRDTARQVLETTVERRLTTQTQEQPQTFSHRFRVNDRGEMPPIEATRNYRILDALEVIGTVIEKDVVVESANFGRVTIRRDACTSCGLCSMFCPTRAIKRVDELDCAEEHESNARCGTRKTFSNYHAPSRQDISLEFSAAECVGCRLCADVCPQDCIVVESAVFLGEVFSFEPRMLL